MAGDARPEIRISRQKLDQDIARLADGLARNKGKWRAVVGVANGGVYPAGKVAERLGLEYCEIRVSSYDGKIKFAPRIIRTIDGSGVGLLIVDDVVDSGDTALLVRGLFPEADFASVYGKHDGLRKLEVNGRAHCCAERFPQKLWIVFPWHQPGWANELPRSVVEYRRRITPQ